MLRPSPIRVSNALEPLRRWRDLHQQVGPGDASCRARPASIVAFASWAREGATSRRRSRRPRRSLRRSARGARVPRLMSWTHQVPVGVLHARGGHEGAGTVRRSRPGPRWPLAKMVGFRGDARMPSATNESSLPLCSQSRRRVVEPRALAKVVEELSELAHGHPPRMVSSMIAGGVEEPALPARRRCQG